MTNELFSIGRVCQLCQRLPRVVERAATAAGVKPAVTIDGVAHFLGDAVDAIRAELTKGEK